MIMGLLPLSPLSVMTEKDSETLCFLAYSIPNAEEIPETQPI
jgi:hypothetical protein